MMNSEVCNSSSCDATGQPSFLQMIFLPTTTELFSVGGAESDNDFALSNDVTGADWSTSKPTTSPLLEDHTTNHVTVFLNFLLSFVICSGNILTLTAISKTRRLQTQPNFYIASLAMADIILGVLIFVRGFSYIQVTHRVFTFSPFSCLVFLSLLYTSMAASIFSLVVVSLDRVINTCYCLLYENFMTPRVTMGLISLTWLLSLVYGTVPLYTSHPPRPLLRCLPTQVLARAYFLHANSVIFLLSCLVIIICYAQITRVFLRHRRQIMAVRPGLIRPENGTGPTAIPSTSKPGSKQIQAEQRTRGQENAPMMETECRNKRYLEKSMKNESGLRKREMKLHHSDLLTRRKHFVQRLSQTQSVVSKTSRTDSSELEENQERSTMFAHSLARQRSATTTCIFPRIVSQQDLLRTSSEGSLFTVKAHGCSLYSDISSSEKAILYVSENSVNDYNKNMANSSSLNCNIYALPVFDISTARPNADIVSLKQNPSYCPSTLITNVPMTVDCGGMSASTSISPSKASSNPDVSIIALHSLTANSTPSNPSSQYDTIFLSPLPAMESEISNVPGNKQSNTDTEENFLSFFISHDKDENKATRAKYPEDNSKESHIDQPTSTTKFGTESESISNSLNAKSESSLEYFIRSSDEMIYDDASNVVTIPDRHNQADLRADSLLEATIDRYNDTLFGDAAFGADQNRLIGNNCVSIVKYNDTSSDIVVDEPIGKSAQNVRKNRCPLCNKSNNHALSPKATDSFSQGLNPAYDNAQNEAAGLSPASDNPQNEAYGLPVCPPILEPDIPSRLRVVRLLAMVCGGFLVCWTPLVLSVLAFYTMGGTFEAISACTTLAVINSAINFFIYGAANNDFRHAFRRLLCRQ
ncbi:beta-2 adrenergic receptor [Plakobranchus ocellatus]|uniref:Beta-2 adrenergic receptor n=1 Tax=Plakobranchus ocellatus TaxID=259542 RepID=A0AAV4AXD0_9GAST|nr:beta-2 adrenergic receptor [Plakobranchus ocellatus]